MCRMGALRRFFEQGGTGTNQQLADKFDTTLVVIRSYISSINKSAKKNGSNYMITKHKHPNKKYAIYLATYQGYLDPKCGRPRVKPTLPLTDHIY